MHHYHPWRHFRAQAAWTLHWADLPPRLHGYTDFWGGTVTLDRRLRQVERRCTIAHEVAHIERGPLPDDDRLAAREESLGDCALVVPPNRTLGAKLVEDFCPQVL